MFENPGRTIKFVAVVVCLMGVIASVISGLALIIDDISLGWLLFFGGSILSWLLCLMFYAFGQLVDNSDKILSQSCAILELLNNSDKLGLQNDEESKQEIQAEDCEEKIPNE